MKYTILARFIRACMYFGVLIISAGMFINICGEIFSTKKYLQIGNMTFGDTTPGYPMRMGLQISVPDTIITFKNSKFGGSIKRNHNSNYSNWPVYKASDVEDKIIQKLVVSNPDYQVSVYNDIRLLDAVQINVNTVNKACRTFWAIYTFIGGLSLMLIFILIIKLINTYLQGEFLNKKSFRLISYVGLLLIFSEVFEFLCALINAKIIPGIHLETSGIRAGFMTSNVEMNLNFGNSVSYSNIGIGIMVIILAKVIKDAVAIKQENDLTI